MNLHEFYPGTEFIVSYGGTQFRIYYNPCAWETYACEQMPSWEVTYPNGDATDTDRFGLGALGLQDALAFVMMLAAQMRTDIPTIGERENR